MHKKPEIVVLDTCVILSMYIKEEKDTRGERTLRLLEQIKADKKIYSLPAICHVEIFSNQSKIYEAPQKVGMRKRNYEQTKQLIAKLGAIYIEHTRGSAELAAQICADYELRAPDALVLASAATVEAKVLYTFDNKLIETSEQFEARFGCRIEEPPELDSYPVSTKDTPLF